MGLSFKVAAGPGQCSHSHIRVPRDPWPHFTVSDSRLLQPGEYLYPTGTGWPGYTSQVTHLVSFTKPSRLKLFRERVAVYCKNHRKLLSSWFTDVGTADVCSVGTHDDYLQRSDSRERSSDSVSTFGHIRNSKCTIAATHLYTPQRIQRPRSICFNCLIFSGFHCEHGFYQSPQATHNTSV
jgi:hypothetical protein